MAKSGWILDGEILEMKVYKVKTEDEWHKLRSQVITASNAATLVGCNPYSSPNKLRNPEPFVGNSYTLIGQVLEPAVVEMVNKILGTKFRLFEENPGEKVFYTKNLLGATPDATDGNILLECKSTRPYTFIKYSGYPPLTYLIQTQVQMYVTNYTECYLAIMSTNLTQENAEIKWPMRIYKVCYNKEICDILNKESKRFQENKTFRVNSKIKKRVKLLLSLCYESIY